MDAAKFKTLTDRQRECLRLVARDRDSSEIARMLDIAPDTVNAHVKAAMAKLGTNSRFAAARALAEFENRDHSLVTLPPVIDPVSSVADMEPVYHRADAEPDRHFVREARATFDAFETTDERGSLALQQEAPRNDLSESKRLLLISAATALLALACFAAAAMTYTVNEVVKPFTHVPQP